MRLDQTPVPRLRRRSGAAHGRRGGRARPMGIRRREVRRRRLSHRMHGMRSRDLRGGRLPSLPRSSRIDARARSAERMAGPVALPRLRRGGSSIHRVFACGRDLRGQASREGAERNRAIRRRLSRIPRRLSHLRYGVGANRRMSAVRRPRTATSSARLKRRLESHRVDTVSSVAVMLRLVEDGVALPRCRGCSWNGRTILDCASCVAVRS